MKMRNKDRVGVGFERQLTLRSMLIGALGAVVITTSSMYVALRMGALPWPTIFVAVLSMALLKLLGNTNLKEINVTHTAMSAGGMVAGGVAFTIPGIWMLTPEAPFEFMPLIAISVAGTLLGLLFTAILRKYFIEMNPHPFPTGQAAYETVVAGDAGGTKAKLLFIPMAIAAVFTYIKDWFGAVPAFWNSQVLAKYNIQFGMYISPMALGIGYIIGPLYTLVWFLGGFLTYFLIQPIGISIGVFSDVGAASAFTSSLGIGLMLGAGVGVLLVGILPGISKIFGFSRGRRVKRRINAIVPLFLAFVVLLLTILTDLNIVVSLLLIFGTWITTTMSASITGQTGINPMEVFGIMVLLALKPFGAVGVSAFLVAGVVAVASGLAGDVLNDFKAGHLHGTDPKAQLVAEGVGGLIGAVVSVLVLFFLFKAYGVMGPGTEFIAPQAAMVAAMVDGLPHTGGFIAGLVIGVLLYVLKVPAMTLGIGVYLPISISATAALGGLIHWIVKKVRPELVSDGTVVASGFLGGEGVTGVLIAIIKVLTMG